MASSIPPVMPRFGLNVSVCSETDRMNPTTAKRKARETHQAYEREIKFQFPISEFQIRVSDSTHSEVWRYFGDLFHVTLGRIVCDRVYCNPCFQNQKLESGLNYFLGALLPRIKHYAKSVSTGNLAIHLHDKHNIQISNSNQYRLGSRSQHRRALKGSNENGNQLTADEQSAQSNNSSCFAGIDSADEFDDDQEPSVIAKTIQKLAVEIVGRISTTNSQSNLIHELRSLLRLGRSNYVCLMKSKGYAEAHRHYAVSMEFMWNLIKSAIVLWKGMADQTLSTYLAAIEYAYKTAPNDFRCDEDWELLGNVLILMSGSVKCCDQSTLVLFAETVD